MAAGPLCDAKAMATALEDAFVDMYNRWLATASVLSTGGLAQLQGFSL
jgi:hypothetical protein